MSWLTLLLQAVGLVVAAAAVASVALGRVEGTSLRASAAAVAVVAFLSVMAPQTYGTLKQLNDQRLMNPARQPDKAREKCLVDGGHADQVAFLRFVRHEMPAKSRYVVVGGSPVDPACLSFVLLPRLMQAGPETSDYAVFTGGIPAGWASKVVPGTTRTFQPGQLVARVR